jgi:hypothetical protein
VRLLPVVLVCGGLLVSGFLAGVAVGRARLESELTMPPPPAPPPTDTPRLDPSANPDLEVCRALNTTCIGPQTRLCQDLWLKGHVGWSHLLTESQINCVVAAQGLARREDRAAWIRHCGTDIPCQ